MGIFIDPLHLASPLVVTMGHSEMRIAPAKN